MTFLDLVPCPACAIHVGHWPPPDRMCPECRALAYPEQEAEQ